MRLSSPQSDRKTPVLARLRRLAAPADVREHCELCSAVLPGEHQHLLDLKSRQLVCACDPCAILFSSDQAARYRRVPRRLNLLSDFALSDETWEMLHIPINLAFFYHHGDADKIVAMYPSPGGATESLLPMDCWADLTGANPVLSRMEKDVEALLVNRVAQRRDALIVPIDLCYRLVGLIRMHWRGLSGGTGVWREVNGFFDDLRHRANPAGETIHA